jgi:hypothetical protein
LVCVVDKGEGFRARQGAWLGERGGCYEGMKGCRNGNSFGVLDLS